MLAVLAIKNYRSLRDVVLPLKELNVVTGANGSGKTNLYRALRLLAASAVGGGARSLVQEGGLEGARWAGPRSFTPEQRAGAAPIHGTGPSKEPVQLRLGFAADPLSYAIDFGFPRPQDPPSLFESEPEIKREVIWAGDVYHARRAVVDRHRALVRVRRDSGRWEPVRDDLHHAASLFTEVADPLRAPEVLLLREEIRQWRFYDQFRTDADAPARRPSTAVRTPALAHDGHDLAAAWASILEVGNGPALTASLEDAFPGARVGVDASRTQLGLRFEQHGLLRPLRQAELSDGTLRYLCWLAALWTPRPPPLLVLNEPENSLHPDLVPALARLIQQASERSQIWVVTHDDQLQSLLLDDPDVQHIALEKRLGETHVQGLGLLSTPTWRWPGR